MNGLLQKYQLKGNPKIGLTMATFGFWLGFGAVSLFGPIATNFNKVMHMPGLMLGFLIAAPQLTGSLLRIPFGAWVDKGGGKKPLLILLFLSMLGMIGLSTMLKLYYPDHLTISMYPVVFLFALLSGCGVATFSVGISQASYWFPQKKQGMALGAYGGLGNTAPGLFGIFLPIGLVSIGLINSYFSWFVFLLIGTIIYATFTQDAYFFQLIKKGVNREEATNVARQLGQELFPSGKIKEALKISAAIPRTWFLVLLYFTSFGGFLALSAWLPTYWIKVFGVDVRAAALLMALGFSLLGSFVRVYGGHMSDKFGGEKISICGFILVLIGSITLVFANSFGVALTGEIILGAGMGIANAAVFKLVPRYVSKAPGGASGWVGGIGAFGGFVVPPIFGSIVDAYGKAGYAKGFIVYVILSAVSILISIYLKKAYATIDSNSNVNSKKIAV